MGTLDGIELLTLAVEGGSFAAAARRRGVTPSAVSRRIAALERELGVPLLARTTRSLRLTNDGQAFYQRCVRILEELGEARDAIARARGKPSGLLRVDVPLGLGRKVIAPQLPRFLERYPELRLDLTLRDQLVDPIAEGLDLVVRLGSLGDSSLIARRLGTNRLVVCAAPAYLRRHGTPTSPADLARHECIGYLTEGRPRPFSFVSGDGIRPVEITGHCHANDAEVIRQLAVAGRGVVALFDFLVAEDLARGDLVEVLSDHPSTSWPVHALYPKNRHLVPKVAVFLDFVAGLYTKARPEPPARRRGR